MPCHHLLLCSSKGCFHGHGHVAILQRKCHNSFLVIDQNSQIVDGICLFVAFGDQDAKMFIASAEHNMDASMEEARYVSKHTVDFAAFLKHYVTDDNGNGRSLSHNLELFDVKFEGQAHDACADAYNLILLYKAFLEKKDIVREEYRKTLLRSRNLPEPIRKVVAQIAEKGSATAEDLKGYIDEELE